MKIFCYFMIYYYICSVLCTLSLWKKFHNKENKEKMDNDLAKFVVEVRGIYKDFKKEDALVGFYLAAIFFSFIIAPMSLFSKFIGKKNV